MDIWHGVLLATTAAASAGWLLTRLNLGDTEKEVEKLAREKGRALAARDAERAERERLAGLLHWVAVGGDEPVRSGE